MRDHRANIKITFEIYGYEDKLDTSINYIPDSDGVAPYIKEFFSNHYERACGLWEVEKFKQDREIEKQREAAARKALYLELKKEFEGEG